MRLLVSVSVCLSDSRFWIAFEFGLHTIQMHIHNFYLSFLPHYLSYERYIFSICTTFSYDVDITFTSRNYILVELPVFLSTVYYLSHPIPVDNFLSKFLMFISPEDIVHLTFASLFTWPNYRGVWSQSWSRKSQDLIYKLLQVSRA